MTPTPDPHPVRPFLEDRHQPLAQEAAAYASRELRPRPEPRDDEAARKEAKALLADLGRAGYFRPIREQDWRASPYTSRISPRIAPAGRQSGKPGASGWESIIRPSRWSR